VAEANAHLEQIMVEQQDKFTVDDQKDMLQNFFAHLSAELEQLVRATAIPLMPPPSPR